MRYVAIFLGALGCSLILTPLFIRIAHLFNVLDVPNPNNPGKIHRKPIALLGGMAIYFAILTVCGFALEWKLQIVGIFAALMVVMILGLLDDLRSLDYRIRLGVQCAVAIFIAFGLDIKIQFLADVPILCYPLTILWIVGLTNALNLMDNVDGATGGITFFAAVGLFIFGYLNNEIIAAVIALALAGASLGFLRYNFKPASIFLGDTGSLLLGFLLAILALLETSTLNFSWNNVFIFPLLLGVPIYDTTLATALRLYYGRPVYLADKSNLTYRLFDQGFSQIEAVMIEYGMAIYFLISAFILWWSQPVHGILVMLITVIALTFLGFRFALLNSTLSQTNYRIPTPLERNRPASYSILVSRRLKRRKIDTPVMAPQTDH